MISSVIIQILNDIWQVVKYSYFVVFYDFLHKE